jgi:hypothetical protein
MIQKRAVKKPLVREELASRSLLESDVVVDGAVVFHPRPLTQMVIRNAQGWILSTMSKERNVL